MAGARRSEAERRLLYTCELRGLSFEQLNEEMRRAGYRPVPIGTYQANLRNEIPLFRRRPELLEQFAKSPVPYGDWPSEWNS